MLQYLRTSDILLGGGRSLDNSYYLFCGSYADRWFIASMLGHLFDRDDKAFVIAAHLDMELLRIFLGERMSRVIPVAESVALQIRLACQADPNSYMPSGNSGIAVLASPQRGCIRSLHLVDYPYFVQLNVSRYVRQLNLQRIIMHLPVDAMMVMPSFVNSEDEECAQAVLRDAGLLNCKSAIINPVNFSHRPLGLEDLVVVSDLLHRYGYKVAFNIAQASDSEIGKKLKEVTSGSILSMPGYLMKTIYDKIHLCVGAYGGAMSIADWFGACNVFSIFTPNIFFPLENLGPDPHDFESMRAEPRPERPRLSRGSSYLAGPPNEDTEIILKELEDMLNQL